MLRSSSGCLVGDGIRYAWFTEEFDTADLQEAKMLLGALD